MSNEEDPQAPAAAAMEDVNASVDVTEDSLASAVVAMQEETKAADPSTSDNTMHSALPITMEAAAASIQTKQEDATTTVATQPVEQQQQPHLPMVDNDETSAAVAAAAAAVATAAAAVAHQQHPAAVNATPAHPPPVHFDDPLPFCLKPMAPILHTLKHTHIPDQKATEPFPDSYQPRVRDICNGRGKSHWNMPGNKAFRKYVQVRVYDYMQVESKVDKTKYVMHCVHELRSLGFQFLREKPGAVGLWYDVGDAVARNKVGHSLRDQVAALRKADMPGKNKSSTATATSSGQRKRKSIAAAASATDGTEAAVAAAVDGTTTASFSPPPPPPTTPTTTTTTVPLLVTQQATTAAAAAAAAGVDVLQSQLTQAMTDLQAERQANKRLQEENSQLKGGAEEDDGEEEEEEEAAESTAVKQEEDVVMAEAHQG